MIDTKPCCNKNFQNCATTNNLDKLLDIGLNDSDNHNNLSINLNNILSINKYNNLQAKVTN